MSKINLLSDDTINKIAAGEVVERPLSVVKELVENSIDAGATVVAVEVKDGGTKSIRITDNGSGIEDDDVRNAFIRHATSKIHDAHDILSVSSLGFRGEALASIASVARCELVTKTANNIAGKRYVIEGGVETVFEDVGAPSGTTIIVRDLFYNTPARRKFLKSANTESAYITDAIEKIALAHPEVAISLISNGVNKVKTLGTGKKKDVIYGIFGREISSQVIETINSNDELSLSGYIGKPSLSRGNRSYEIFEVNGRTINSKILTKAVEDAYHGFVMQHRCPVAIISLKLPAELLDVNVHPAKLEVRFRKEDEIYEFVKSTIENSLRNNELIVEEVEVVKQKEEPVKEIPIQPFEDSRILDNLHYASDVYEDVVYEVKEEPTFVQEELKIDKILSSSSRPDFKILGILFNTYILVEYKQDFLMIDQHAAHEKVNYENFMKQYREKKHTSQAINPPIVLTLSDKEMNVLNSNIDAFRDIGYELEAFGGKEMLVRAVPGNIFDKASADILIEMLDDLSDEFGHEASTLIPDKIAMMSCKAAVKGNQSISMIEAEALIDKLLRLQDPYTCPHGRPTTIKMSKQDVEKKFKRIV